MLQPTMGRKMSRSWCFARHSAFTTVLLVVSCLRTVTPCSVTLASSPASASVENISPARTVVARFPSTGVKGVSAATTYFDVTYNSTSKEITLLTNKEFESYEITKNAPTIQVFITYTCNDTSQKSFQVNVQLTLENKYAPLFISKGTPGMTSLQTNVSIPLPRGYTVMGGCEYSLQVIDYGLDDHTITFTVDKPDSFAVTTTETTISEKPAYEVVVRTTAVLNFETPMVVTLNATDGGKPSKSTELQLTLTPDAAESTPPNPWFSQAVYTGEITETMSSGGTITFTPEIKISEGYEESLVAVSLESADGNDDPSSMFTVDHTKEIVSIKLAKQPTEDFLKKPFYALVLKATRSKALKEGRTVILLSLPGSKPVTTTTSSCPQCPETTACPTIPSNISTPSPTDCSDCPASECSSTSSAATGSTSDCSHCPTVVTACPTIPSNISTPCPTDCAHCPASECSSTSSPATGSTSDCSHCPTVTTDCPVTSTITSTSCPTDCSQCPASQCSSTTSAATVSSSSISFPTGCPQCPETTTACPTIPSNISTPCPIDCSHCPASECSSTSSPATGSTSDCSHCPIVTDCPVTCNSTATTCPIDCSHCPLVTTASSVTASGSSTQTVTNCPQCPTTECPITVSGTATCTPCPVTVSGTATCTPCPVTVNGTATCPTFPPTVSGAASCPTCPTVSETTPCETDCSKCPVITSKPTTVSSTSSQGSGSTESTTGSSTVTPAPQLVKFNASMYEFSGQWPCSGGSVTLGKVAATVVDGQGSPIYSLEGAPGSVKIDSKGGNLTLKSPLVPKNYIFKVVAEWMNSKDKATVIVAVPNVNSCGTNSTKLQYVFVITDFDEEGAFNVSGPQHLGDKCIWTKTSEEPPNKNFFHVSSDGTISTACIDREDEVFAGRELSEVLLQVNVNCSEEEDQDLIPEDTSDPSKAWYPLKSLRTSSKEVTYLAVVNDINDNKPQFNTSLLFVGYPDQQLAKQLVPQSLATVHATDKDSGLNAYIRYEIVRDGNDGSSQFVIHPHSGTLYPSENSFAFKDTNFKVIAKDLDGAEGCLQSDYLQVQVRILGSQHVTVLTVEGRLVEDTDTLLDQIMSSTGVTVKVLSSAVVPSATVSTRSWFSLQLLADQTPASLLRLVVYGLDTSADHNPVPFSSVKQKLVDANLGFKWDMSQLPESSSGKAVIDAGYNTGLIAAVATLGVLLGLALIAVAAIIYFLHFRRRRGTSDSSYDDIIRADSSESPSFSEPPVSAYEADIMVAYNEQLNKYDEQQQRTSYEPADDNFPFDDEVAAPKKSVAFSPDVAHIGEESEDTEAVIRL